MEPGQTTRIHCTGCPPTRPSASSPTPRRPGWPARTPDLHSVHSTYDDDEPLMDHGLW